MPSPTLMDGGAVEPSDRRIYRIEPAAGAAECPEQVREPHGERRAREHLVGAGLERRGAESGVDVGVEPDHAHAGRRRARRARIAPSGSPAPWKSTITSSAAGCGTPRRVRGVARSTATPSAEAADRMRAVKNGQARRS
jgi:hypothetical protein